LKKITCSVLVILYTLILTPLLSVAQILPNLNNRDSLAHYLKMEKHPDYPEAPAFVMHKTLEQQFNTYSTDFTLELVLKIFNARDIKTYTDFVVPDFFENRKFKELKVIIYNLENGEVRKTELNRKSLSKTSSDNQDFKLTGTSNIKDGSIIHYRLSSNSEGFIPGFNFQEELPVAYAAFKLKLVHAPKILIEEEVKIPLKKFTDKNNFYKSNLPAIAATYEEGDYTIHSWIRRNLPPLDIFSSNKGREKVSFNFFNEDFEKHRKENEVRINAMTWQDFNTNRYNYSYRIAFEENDYLYKLVPKIIDKEKDSLTIARNLFKYIQEKFTVGNIDKIFDFAIIDESKKATPPTLNLFLCALYRHAGFQSDLVYVSTDRQNALVPDKVREKNTAIAVRVIMNGVSYFCNPANKQLPFGYLPYNYYNGYSRLINKSGGEVILSPELAKSKHSIDAELSPHNNAHSKFRLRINKNFSVLGSVYERWSYTDDSIAYKADYKKYLEILIPKLSISNYTLKVENLKNIDAPFMLIAEADIELSDSSGLLYLDPFLQKVNDGRNLFQNVKDRETDIEMHQCYNFDYTFRFRLNDHIAVEKLPAKTSFQYASPATIKYAQEANYNALTKTIEVKYNYDIIPGSYNREEVADLSAFYTKVMKANNQKLLLHKK